MSHALATVLSPNAARVIETERAVYLHSAPPRSWASLQLGPIDVRAWGAWFAGELCAIETEQIQPNGGRPTARRVAVVWVPEVRRHLYIGDLRRMRMGACRVTGKAAVSWCAR